MEPNATTYRVQSSTQLTFEGVRIGVGNIRTGEYTDEKGVLHTVLTAGLWLYFRDDPAQDRQVRVHASQIITVSGYSIKVIEIDTNAVQLSIIPPS